MKCIEKIYRKEGCARNGLFSVPKSIYRAQKKTMSIWYMQRNSLETGNDCLKLFSAIAENVFMVMI